MRSLVRSLTVGLGLSLLAVFAAQWSAAGLAIESMLEDSMLAELERDGEELHDYLAIGGSDLPAFSVGHFDPVFFDARSGRYFQISGPGVRTLRSPSLGDFDIADAAPAPGRATIGRHAGPQGQELLVSTVGHEREGRSFRISVAADIGPLHEQVRAFLVRYTLLTLAMFAMLVLLQAWIVRRSLAPLRDARREVDRLERGEIAQLGESVPAEVLPLVRSINQLLGLLGARLQRSREALGNLSHALKTPLTLLTQLSGHAAIRSDPVLHAELQAQLQNIGERIERELRRARAAGQSAHGPALDPAPEIDALVMTMRRLHADRALDIVATVSSQARFRGDREDLLELCGNLLDNACKWAAHRVCIDVRDTGGFVLTVEDDGPGCSGAETASIVERGVRLDEATAGHGLGLAIVRNIASSCGGELHIGRSASLGGLLARVTLPDAFGMPPAADGEGRRA